MLGAAGVADVEPTVNVAATLNGGVVCTEQYDNEWFRKQVVTVQHMPGNNHIIDMRVKHKNLKNRLPHT
jgi:hypothetical protein